MKKLEKLKLNKKVVSELKNEEMKKLEGGAFGSHVCGTYWNTGGCYGTSNSCSGTFICF
jgi:natural product precursor